jgi:hydroxymethylglutaryl-CoA lyase
MPETKIQLVECPRDAMQGWSHFIPTDKKAEYINALLKTGFDIIDFGSFVSPAAIPQMADTRAVVPQLVLDGTDSRLLSIVANLRGAGEAVLFDEISLLGFPFSVSETFQKRNTNRSLEEAFQTVEKIRTLCEQTDKELVVYISMGFGNPYGDVFSEEIVVAWVRKLAALDIRMISLADTVGLATPELVYSITSLLVESLPGTEIGVHLHSSPFNRQAKVDAALRAGCKRFDGALKGYGGCPMANDTLVGNIDTEWLISYFRELQLPLSIRSAALQESLRLAEQIFQVSKNETD